MHSGPDAYFEAREGRRVTFHGHAPMPPDLSVRDRALEDDGLSVGADPVYRLTWTLVSPAPGPLMRAPSPLETTLTQSESLPL